MSINSRSDDAFHALLAAWNHHQDLRHHGGSLAELTASRVHLDQQRRALR